MIDNVILEIIRKSSLTGGARLLGSVIIDSYILGYIKSYDVHEDAH